MEAPIIEEQDLDTPKPARVAVARNAISWDDASIDREASKLPAELREGFKWLKRYARNGCGRDVDVLMQRFRDHGVDTHETNYVRVLKGMWKWDRDGREKAAPCITQDRLLTEIKSLQDDIRVEFLRGKLPFFRTSTFELIKNFIEKRRRREAVNKFGVIIGATGLQKSASFRELALADPTFHHIESPENGVLGELVTEVAMEYGETENTSQQRKRRTISRNFNEDQCLCLDNAQDLILLKRGSDDEMARKQPCLSFLRRLQDRRRGTIIQSITPYDEAMLLGRSVYMEQFLGRIGGRESVLRLPDYPPAADLLLIARGMKMADAEEHQDELVQLSRIPGRIRVFFEWIQEGKADADAEEQEFTWAHVATRLEEKNIVLEPKKEK